MDKKKLTVPLNFDIITDIKLEVIGLFSNSGRSDIEDAVMISEIIEDCIIKYVERVHEEQNPENETVTH